MIYIHIPKNAGTSVNSILKKWFKSKHLYHYFSKHHKLYRRKSYRVEPGVCISGHFNHARGQGVDVWYPSVNQIPKLNKIHIQKFLTSLLILAIIKNTIFGSSAKVFKETPVSRYL